MSNLIGDLKTPPNASILLEALRSVGYSLEMAVADIIDNSISAHAKNIFFEVDEVGRYLMISDDGVGLTDSELIESLRLGSKDPLLEREAYDLGRFGLGLKTSSFSHCRKLTVASKTKDSEISIYQWDLDYIRTTNDWYLRIPPIDDYPEIREKLDSFQHGTVVFWENIDRFIKSEGEINSKEEKLWYAKEIEKVNHHLEMVFHRYLEDLDFTLYLTNGKKAKPWDPFLIEKKSTPLTASEDIPGILVYPYLLPHKTMLNEKEYEAAAGPLKTWAKAQGFYVYREKRLIMPGTWLNLPKLTKSRDTELTRIKLEITNENDAEWMLDVKKTSVKVPRRYKKDLEDIAKNARDYSRKAYSFRGKVDKREVPGNRQFIWNADKDKNNNVRYKINRSHPLIEKVLSDPGKVTPKQMNAVFKLIEELIPVQAIILEDIQNPETIIEPFDRTEKSDFMSLMKSAAEIMEMDSLSTDEKKAKLLSVEPFTDHPEIIEILFESDN